MTQKIIQVFRNTEYEEKVKKDLQISRDAMQKILNEWLILEIGPCMGLNDLVLRPRAVFDRAINDMITVPQTSGPFKINPAQYKEQLVLPDPSALFDACKKALQLPYCAMYGIFIVNDFIVEIDKEGANELIDSQSIYASGDKVKLAEDLTKFVELFNSLNSRLNYELFDSGNPVANSFFRGLFTFKDTNGRGNNGKLALIPDTLKRWLSL
ncbi:MAG: hypothetical protein WC389_11550 [Lutibacter sp.]|jgi:hypothetical protein